MPSLRVESQQQDIALASAGQYHDMTNGEVVEMDPNDPDLVWQTEETEDAQLQVSGDGDDGDDKDSSEAAEAFDRSHKASQPSGREKPEGYKTKRGHLHDGSNCGI